MGVYYARELSNLTIYIHGVKCTLVLIGIYDSYTATLIETKLRRYCEIDKILI